jgi:hypothetical protein
MMGVGMRSAKSAVIATLVGASLVAGAAMVQPAYAQCDTLTCQQDCEAEHNACELMRSTLRQWLREFCRMDALDVRFDCVDAKTQADENCGELCGTDFKECRSTNKIDYRLCVINARPGQVECKAEIKAELAEAKIACALDLDACLAVCGGT